MKHKVESTNKLKISGILDAEKFMVTIGDELIDLKEYLLDFHNKEVQINVTLSNVIAEED